METKIKTEEKPIILGKINKQMAVITVQAEEGSTLIVHRLGKEQMDKVMSKEKGTSRTKTFRNFEAEYKSCFYTTAEGKYGFPASGFMASVLDAATNLEGIHKTTIKRSIRLLGDVYELRYKKLNHRVDYPRRSGPTAAPDERHRPEFVQWECDLLVQFDADRITIDQIYNLIQRAGFSTGIGDWRPGSPKSSGTHGMFKIKTVVKDGKKAD